MNGVVVVGTGIAGVRAAEALRGSGYAEEIAFISPETPIYRPSVSKEALKAPIVGQAAMPLKRSATDFTWLLGHRVEAADLATRSLLVRTPEGEEVTRHFDGLVIASGLRSRQLAIPGPTLGRFTLRTLHDAQELEPHLKPDARIVIVGSGFIGCEVAAAAIARGCQVTVISPETTPLASAIGLELGERIAAKHRAEGVSFILDASVVEFLGAESGQGSVTGLLLDDGTRIEADVVIEAVGSRANTEWLDDNNLDLVNGVLTDGFLRAVGTDQPVVVCGDIARHPNALFGPEVRRIEHWTAAGEMGTYAGKVMGQLLTGTEISLAPFANVPGFWSDQYDLQIQSFGIPSMGSEVVIIDSDADGNCIAEYRDASGLVGVVGINRTSEIAYYRKLLNSRI
ncbi:unannotated protein [freshwater metagenome]|uniref:Unannotated protein n=1 Tax=freshwater metagenome TaxID=449393 RepID=A0A6J7RYI2_9ZZZZ